MTDAFRCDGCDEYHDAEFQFLDIEMDTDIVDLVDFTLDDIPTDAYGILCNESGQGDLSGDFCPECGMAVLTDLVEQFREDNGAVDEDDHVEDADHGEADDDAVDETDNAPDQADDDDVRDDDADDADSLKGVLDTAVVKSYGVYFNRDVAAFFANVDRVTVREQDGQYELAPGTSEEWPDYAVSQEKIQLSTRGARVLDADVGDEIRATANGDAVALEVVGRSDEHDDGEEREVESGENQETASSTSTWNGAGETGSADLEEPSDEDDIVDALPEEDGEPVCFADYSADAGSVKSAECQNCGSHVDRQFVRVFEPEDEEAPRVCPNCEDLIRDGNSVRRKRA